MKDEILEAALERFLAQGYHATTTRQVTDDVGLTPAALYYHYPGKDALLIGLVEPYLSELDTLLATEPAPGDSSDATRDFMRRYRELLIEHHGVARLIERDPAVHRHESLGPRIDELAARLRAHLVGREPNEDDEARASAAIGALRRPTLWLESRSDVVIDAALAALGADPAAS